MFGNPTWFRKKSRGWGLAPVTWPGWVYTGTWTAAVCLPFVALVASHRVIEAVIWVAVSMTALMWDVRQVIKGINRRERDEDVLIIDETTQPDPPHLATRAYDLHWRP